MANLNKVMLIGRLTRDPEMILTDKGVKFGFAVNNSRKNAQTGQWEDEPVFIDCEMWNRMEGAQQATRLFQTVRKGQQLFIEGKLKLDTWDDKNGGGKRSQLRVVVESFQYLEPRQDGEAGGQARQYNQAAPRQQAAAPPMNRQAAPARQMPQPYHDEYSDAPMGAPAAQGGDDEDKIPF